MLSLRKNKILRKEADFVAKKSRIVDTYLEGLIDKNTRDLRLKKLQDDISIHQEAISVLEGKKRAIMGMLEEGEKDAFETFLVSYKKKAPPWIKGVPAN
jgi:hypothetical protein